MIAVQSTKSNAVSKTVKKIQSSPSTMQDITIEPVKATTLADSISVDMPRDGIAAVKAVLESEGDAVEVDDEEILSAIRTLAGSMGIFAEPAGAASYAGLLKLKKEKKLSPEDEVVCLITGSGLKDIGAVMNYAGRPPVIEPTLQAARKIINERWK